MNSVGDRASTVTGRGTIKVMTYQRGEEPVPSLLNHYRGHKGPILSLAFHPNMQTLFSSSADGFIMNWSYRKETRALRFEGHCGAVNEVNLSQHGDLMVTASDDCTARVWVPIIAGQFLVVKGHTAAVRSACFSPVDSTVFATASNDKTIKVWSVQSAKTKSGVTKFKSHDFLQSFRNHNNWVRSVKFSQDGRLLCSASDDKTVRVFDLRSKECTATIAMPSDIGCPLHADFNPCGNSYIGVSTSEKAFLMYDVRQKQLLQSYVDLFQGAVNSFSFHPSGDFATCVSEDSRIKILDLIEGRPIFTLHGPRKGINACAFNSTGSLFATGGKDDEVLIWEPVLLPYANCSNETAVSDKENVSLSSEKTSEIIIEEKQNIDVRIPSTSKGIDMQSLSRTSSARTNSSSS